jgi:hypothetical protein
MPAIDFHRMSHSIPNGIRLHPMPFRTPTTHHCLVLIKPFPMVRHVRRRNLEDSLLREHGQSEQDDPATSCRILGGYQFVYDPSGRLSIGVSE